MKSFYFNAFEFRQLNQIGFLRDLFVTERACHFTFEGHHRDIRNIKAVIHRFIATKPVHVEWHEKTAEKIVITISL